MRLSKKIPFLLSMIPLLFACTSKTKRQLNLLVWEGYADASFIKEFEKTHDCKVSASYMGSSDELVAKLKGGSASNYDVISPSSDVAAFLTKAGLATPLDLSKIPTYSKLTPKLTGLSLVKHQEKTFGVPFMWGPNPLLFDTKALPTVPTSWSLLWDPKWKGKVAIWDDLSTIYLAAQMLGFDKPDPSALYNLRDDQLAQVKTKLLELKPNIRKMWATGGELVNLFQNHEIVASMGWPLMTNQLKKANFPIGETIPQENTTGWMDHLMIISASENKELAYAFLEYMIQANTQKLLSDITAYIPANPEAAVHMTEAQQKSLHLHELEAYTARIYFWQHVERRNKYTEVWNEVKAAL